MEEEEWKEFEVETRQDEQKTGTEGRNGNLTFPGL